MGSVYDINGPTEHNAALAEAIEKRRRALGLTVTGLVTKAGVTAEGLRPLRRGDVRSYQERLTVPVCRALEWSPDSIDRILAGLEPIEVEVNPPDVDLLERIAQMDRDLVALRSLLVETIDRWTAEQRLVVEAMELLKRQADDA